MTQLGVGRGRVLVQDGVGCGCVLAQCRVECGENIISFLDYDFYVMILNKGGF
jgi:hypothetical protein